MQLATSDERSKQPRKPSNVRRDARRKASQAARQLRAAARLVQSLRTPRVQAQPAEEPVPVAQHEDISTQRPDSPPPALTEQDSDEDILPAEDYELQEVVAAGSGNAEAAGKKPTTEKEKAKGKQKRGREEECMIKQDVKRKREGAKIREIM